MISSRNQSFKSHFEAPVLPTFLQNDVCFSQPSHFKKDLEGKWENQGRDQCLWSLALPSRFRLPLLSELDLSIESILILFNKTLNQLLVDALGCGFYLNSLEN
jgi:hypothetical protein